MSISHTSTVSNELGAARTVESRYLYQIINTVSSTLDLDRVLRAIVDLVSEAIDCHACWIYFVDPDDHGLVLRAVSDPYSALAGRLRFEPGEGLAGWVAEHNQAVFIPENAPDDPRAKVVPEAEEEKYQSLCAAPLQAKAGHVIGVIALHAQAPREFTRADSDFLVHAATLVAGAIENARLYEDTRRRLSMVEGLSDLARALSAASTLESLLPAVARRAQRLLEASCCDVLVADADGHTLTPGAAWPEQQPAPRSLNVNELGLELALSARGGGAESSRRLAAALWGDDSDSAVVVPMVAADELVGVLALRYAGDRRIDAEQREIATSVANQAAVAIKKVQLIDRLTERNAIKDLLEDLSHGSATPLELEERAATLGSGAAAGAGRGRMGVGRRVVRARGGAGIPRIVVRPARRGAARADPAVGRWRGGGRRAVARDPHQADAEAPVRGRPVQPLQRARLLSERVQRGRPRRGRRLGGQQRARRRRVRRPGRVQVPAEGVSGRSRARPPRRGAAAAGGLRPAPPLTAAADARGVPAPPRQHRGGCVHPLCAPQHPPAAAAPHPGPDRAGRRP
jgi:GAF domain-containing protein